MSLQPDVNRGARLVELWPRSIDGPAFLTTYTFQGAFFESRLLRELLARRAHPIVVFVDRHVGYGPAVASIPALRFAGLDYLLAPVTRRRGAFHPKVHLFPFAGRALCGSGNLTPSGCGDALEAFDVLDAGSDGRALGEVREFFDLLLASESTVVPASLRPYLRSCLGRPPVPSGGARFFHSLKAELAEQLKPLVPHARRDRALLAAPFHDSRHETAMELCALLDAQEIHLAGRGDAEPPRIMKWRTGVLDDRRGRGHRLHAKILRAGEGESALLVVGSANMTRAAWKGANVEAIVVRQGVDAERAAAFLDGTPFRSATWVATADGTKEPTGGADSGGLAIATIHGRRITVLLQGVSGVPEFLLEDGQASSALNLERGGEGEWSGVLAEVPSRSRRLRVVANGRELPLTLVLNIDDILDPTHRLRLVRERRSTGGEVDIELRAALLSEVGKLLQALLQRQPTGHRNPGEGSRSETAGAGDSMAAPLPAAVGSFEVPELGAWQMAHDGFQGRLNQVVALISASLLPRADAAQSKPESRIRNSPQGTSGLSLEELEDEDVDPEDLDPSEDDESGERVADDSLPVTLAFELVQQFSAQEPSLRELSLDRALVVVRAITEILRTLAQRLPDRRRELHSRATSWLVAAWTTEEWPDGEPGWALNAVRRAAGSVVAPSALDGEVEAATFFLIPSSTDVPAPEQPTPSYTAAIRIARGLGEACDLLQTQVADPILQRLRVAPAPWDEARELMEPVWNLELLARAAETQARAGTGPPAGATAPAAPHEQELGRLQAASALGPESFRRLLAAWKRSPWAGPRSRPFRLAPPKGGACPSCHVMIPSGVLSRLRNPLEFVKCSTCPALLARGPNRARP